MVAMTVTIEWAGAPPRATFWGAVRAAWGTYRAHRRQRLALVRLSRLSPRLIRDAGLDPEGVLAALEGSWDEAAPMLLVRALPKAGRL